MLNEQHSKSPPRRNLKPILKNRNSDVFHMKNPKSDRILIKKNTNTNIIPFTDVNNLISQMTSVKVKN